MRPETLNPLFRSVLSLKGVGDATREALQRLLGSDSPRLRDLLFHLPTTNAIDRRMLQPLSMERVGEIVTTQLTVQQHYAPPPKRKGGGRGLPYRVVCADGNNTDVMLLFFNAKSDYILQQLPVGAQRIVSGKLEVYDGVLQLPHPDLIAKPEDAAQVLTLEPTYPLTYAISQKKLRALISQALAQCPLLPEWLMPQTLAQQGWCGWRDALARLHAPQAVAEVSADSSLRARLAYDELLAHQLSLAVVRDRLTRKQGIIIDASTPCALQRQCLAALPFALTAGQVKVLAEIAADMSSGHRMLRLLQGDVGSGKTIVALLAMLPVIAQGYQAAIMVPTDILGRQHLASIQQQIASLGLKAVMLSGKMSSAERAETLAVITSGQAQIIIGTHALFQEAVQFHRLALVVIDEQHRFGVRQRLALTSKGQAPHVLLMTATPIPRSLTMTAYGDMDCSLLPDKPANRLPIDTRAVPLSRLPEVVEGLKRIFATPIAQRNKAYWICPLVEEPDPDEPLPEHLRDVAAAEERFRTFQALFGARVALVHGRMSLDERESVMQGFAGDSYDLLVATTVVEVGVNVPQATIMVIEHAERFGLAQLHQLRGRVGRGADKSSCILLYGPRCSQVAQERLKIIRETNDGFRIAEEDAILRGAGDVLGTRQSGMPDFFIADKVPQFTDLMRAAREEVKWVMHHDAPLTSERGQALRLLLYLFGYDEALRYLDAG
jgi:ATP-dependent DNA helicase RecG